MELASWSRRVVATLIDFLIVGLFASVLLIALGTSVLGIGSDDDAGFVAWIGAALLSVLFLAVLVLLYAPVLMARTGPHNGKTFGKQLVGIRVGRDDGDPYGFWAAVLREVVVKNLAVGIASAIIPVLPWLLDVLWPLWDDENRALHDIAVSSHVYRV
jgi:uncharacterized RDD family membrane protein YckC